MLQTHMHKHIHIYINTYSIYKSICVDSTVGYCNLNVFKCIKRKCLYEFVAV